MNRSYSSSIAAAMAAALLAGVTLPGAAWSEPVKWEKRDGGNGHWYEAVWVPEGINWPEAAVEAFSRGCGWHLATITSPEEDEFVFGLIANNDDFFIQPNDGGGIDVHGPWLGGFQRNSFSEPDGNWRWVTRESFDYTNWDEGEPNDDDGIEDFLHYKRIPDPEGDIPIWNDSGPERDPALKGYIVESDGPRRDCRGQR